MHIPEFITRHYTSSDHAVIKDMLTRTGQYVEQQDGQPQLDAFAKSLPGSILVCQTTDGKIVGSTYVPDGPTPLIARRVAWSGLNQADALAVHDSLHDASSDELRRRGHDKAIELFDEHHRPAASWEWFGFGEPQNISSYLRPLWNADGSVTADIPLDDAPVRIRPYTPMDYSQYRAHREAAGDSVLQAPQILRGFVDRTPTSLILAQAVDSSEIIGSMHVPRSPIPVIETPVITPEADYGDTARAALYNRSFSILRHWGMPQVEELRERGEYLAEYGFRREWDLIQVSRPLWQPDGTPWPSLS